MTAAMRVALIVSRYHDFITSRLEAGARAALRDLTAVRPYVPAKPTTITIDLGTVDTAAQFMGRPGVEIVDPLKVVSHGRDWMEAWNQIWKY